MRYCVACLLVFTLFAFGCAESKPPKGTEAKPRADGKQHGDFKPYPASAWFESDPVPEPLGVKGNPLDYAGAKIGLDVRGMELPRGHEGAYRFAARFPIIDYVSNRPLYMKEWTESTAQKLMETAQQKGANAFCEMLDVLRDCGSHVRDELPAETVPYEAPTALMADTNFAPKYLHWLLYLRKAWLSNSHEILKLRQNLTPEDIAYFEANPGRFIAPDGKTMPPLTGDVTGQLEFIERSRRVSYQCIFDAAWSMANSVEKYLDATAKLSIEEIFIDTTRANEIYVEQTPFGRFVVAGFGNDTHTEDAAFLVDLGGNDTYTNNAGGTGSSAMRVAVCVDHRGNDAYRTPNRNYTQGFGFLGVGILADVAGNDVYEGKHFCQGAGIMGTGLQYDKSGDDKYIAHAFNQGAAIFGIGMLLDMTGEDYYDTATLGQGGASTLGFGILCDMAGDDRYHLSIGAGKDALGSAGYGQGGALSFRSMPWRGKLTAYGGVGLLVDAEGNDRYRTGGWCDQGGSYIMSLGALYDHSGNDHYTAGTGNGSGIHITNAILIDREGNDIYDGGFRTGGSGGDRSPGFLIDYAGDDTYRAGSSSFGTGCKPFSYSLMIDYAGNDKYIAPNPKDKILMNNWDSFGGVWPESEPNLWPYAICLDLGGKDDYKVRNRANNTQRHSFGHGIHIDMEWSGDDVVGKVECPHPPYPAKFSKLKLENEKHETAFKLLNSENTFARFSAVGMLTGFGTDIAEEIVERLLATDHIGYHRDAMEVLHTLMVSKQITSAHAKLLARLLACKVAETRTVIADDFGVFLIYGAETELSAALKDADASVRRYAITALLNLGRASNDKALYSAADLLSAVKRIAESDPSEDVRRVAVLYFASFASDDKIQFLLGVLENDKHSAPKVLAAALLANNAIEGQTDAIVAALRKTAATKDAYLMRACGKALAELGYAEGIDLLIDSMEFPSIDAFFNYNYNIPNFLAAYTGTDFSEGNTGERYNPENWRKWMAANRDKLDLKANIAAHRDFAKLPASISTDADLDAYELFLKQYPNHTRARKALAGYLNSTAWNLVTAQRDTPAFDAQKGLRYAIRCCELDDDANYLDTLAEAYEVNGMIAEALKVCEDALKKYPGNGMFTDRIKRLRQ